MKVGNGWIKGVVVEGERTGDGAINMETEDKRKYWCGVFGEYIHFRKCEDSLGDLITNADKIRSMSDEELAEYIFGVSEGSAPCVICSMDCDFCEATAEQCKEKTLNWLKSPTTD